MGINPGLFFPLNIDVCCHFWWQCLNPVKVMSFYSSWWSADFNQLPFPALFKEILSG